MRHRHPTPANGACQHAEQHPKAESLMVEQEKMNDWLALGSVPDALFGAPVVQKKKKKKRRKKRKKKKAQTVTDTLLSSLAK